MDRSTTDITSLTRNLYYFLLKIAD